MRQARTKRKEGQASSSVNAEKGAVDLTFTQGANCCPVERRQGNPGLESASLGCLPCQMNKENGWRNTNTRSRRREPVAFYSLLLLPSSDTGAEALTACLLLVPYFYKEGGGEERLEKKEESREEKRLTRIEH